MGLVKKVISLMCGVAVAGMIYGAAPKKSVAVNAESPEYRSHYVYCPPTVPSVEIEEEPGVLRPVKYLTKGDYPSWSPDGKKIAYIADQTCIVDVANIDAEDTGYQNFEPCSNIHIFDLEKDTHTPLITKSDDFAPAWSPDGSKIAFNGGWDIYVMNADGTNQKRLTYNSGFDGFSSWSPNGKEIVYACEIDGNKEICKMNQDGSNKKSLTNHSGWDNHPSWSPDGKKIAFSSWRNSNDNIELYVMDAYGNNVNRLTYDSADNEYPTWSPDGKKIAFALNRRKNGKIIDQDHEIYIMNVDGTGKTRLTYDSADDRYPSWFPDGSKIAFRSGSDITVIDVGVKKNLILLFIDSDTYAKLPNRIHRYIGDIEKDAFLNADVQEIVNNWKSAKGIRDLIKKYYKSNNLLGSVLIGDIPTGHFELKGNDSDSHIISDSYFENLNNEFVDRDNNGLFEIEHASIHRNVWSARIKPPVKGETGIELLKKYFDKNHKYRTKELKYERKMLHFSKGDLKEDLDKFSHNYCNSFNFDNIYFFYDDSSKLKNELKKHYKFGVIHAHGEPTRNQALDFREIKEIKPNPFLTHLQSCSNGKFDVENYLAGWYLFSGDALVVRACSGVTNCSFSLQDPNIIFGEMQRRRHNIYFHLFGDPTLSFGFDKHRSDHNQMNH